MNWYAKINSVDNGFTVDYFDGEGKRQVVYQRKEDNSLDGFETDKEHIVDMFYDLLDFFGESSSKHHKKRLNITYEKQEG